MYKISLLLLPIIENTSIVSRCISRSRDVLTMQSGHYMTRRLFALKLIVNKVAVN